MTDDSGRDESDVGTSRERQLPLRSVHFLLLPLVLFVVIPAHILAGSTQDLASFEPAGLLLLGMTAVPLTLFLLALGQLEARLTSRRFYSMVVEFLLFLVVITGFVLPASASSGIIDPEAAPVDITHLLIASAIAFAMLLVAGSTRRSALYAAIGAFVGINALLTVPAIYSLVVGPAVASSSGVASIFSLSRDRNILVVSFDGISGSAAREVLEGDGHMKERFAGFTLYAGVASSSPVTSASTATSLTGNPDVKERQVTVEELWDSSPERLITNQLDRNRWLTSTYGAYTYRFREPSRAYAMLARRPPPSPFRLLNYGLARSLTRLFAVSGSLADRLDDLSAAGVAYLTGSSYDPSMRFVASHVPWWKRGPLTPTVLDFSAYLDNLKMATEQPVAHFLHFTHTHYPVEFDQACRWAAWDSGWYVAHQNRDGVLEQTRCALTQLADYLDKLRALDAFDNSLIVLKSDHGMPMSYYEGDSIESFRIRSDSGWAYGNYEPFLAIKAIWSDGEGMSVDEHAVLLDDLARTLCVHAGIDADCQTYNGVNLLADDWTGNEDDEVTIFIVAGEGSRYLFDTYEPLTIARGSRILTSMHSRLSGEMLRSSVSCEEGIDIVSGVPLHNGRTDGRSWLTWHDRGSSFLRFRLDEPCSSMTVLIGEGNETIDPAGLEILVDGDSIEPRVEGIASLSVPASTYASSRDLEIELRSVDGDGHDPVPIRRVTFGGALDAPD